MEMEIIIIQRIILLIFWGAFLLWHYKTINKNHIARNKRDEILIEHAEKIKILEARLDEYSPYSEKLLKEIQELNDMAREMLKRSERN